MLKCTHTYQISYKPPALRAIEISSLPYFSSADALHGQNNNTAKPHDNAVTLFFLVQSKNKSASPPHFQELLHVFACPSTII